MVGRKTVFFLTILTLIGLGLFVRLGRAQRPTPPPQDTPAAIPQNDERTSIVGRAVGFAETKPASEVARQSPGDIELTGETEEMNELNTGFMKKPNANAPQQRDDALQSSFGADGRFRISIPAPILTFEGVGVNGGSPADTNGAVGPNDYVQTVNVRVQIFDKAGVPRGPAFLMSSLLKPLGGVCGNNDNGDPLVVYDRIANRWVISQFAFTSSDTGPYHQCFAVSKTADPTGAYWAYDFITPGDDFPDYGKLGVWPDGYYFTDRQFTKGTSYNGFGAFAFERAKMLVGDKTASFIYFNAGPGLSNSSSGMIPTDYYGLTPPPPGSPNVFAVYNDDSDGDSSDALRLFNFHADFAVPANSTFLERPESPLPVAAFDNREPSGRADVEEPPPATAADYLDTIGDRLMLRLMYYNRGGTETLTTCHTVNAGILPAPGIAPTVAEYKAGTRWYILQKNSAAAPWTVQNQSTFAPDANERWMGSTSTDNAGNLAVGYSISSLTTFPSIGYAGRLATDPPNVLSGEQTMFAGTGSQTVTGNRWGDYSSMSLDPTDDATFWFTTQYILTSGPSLWHTRIGSFKFAGTVPPPQGTLSGTVTACDSGAVIKDALVQVSGGPSNGFSSATKSDGTYSMKLSPGNYSVTVIDPAHLCTAIGPFNVVVNNGATTTQNGCVSGLPTFLFESSAVSVTGGNGNGLIEPNECNNVNVRILNNGCLIGKNVSATLSTSTPGVTVTQGNSPYPDVNESGSAANTVPFAVSTANSLVCGTTLNFTLTVKYDGGVSTFPLSLPTCPAPPITVTGALTAADPQQQGRLGRNFASSCGVAKACPGPLGAGPRLYHTHTFTNGPAPTCLTVQTTPTCSSTSSPIITAAYANSYDPTNFCTNYVGDSATVGTGNTFGFDFPANATLVLVVEEANAGLGGCTGYSLTVSGLVGSSSGSAPCAPAPTVVSRKVHAGAGTFDIPMPLTGPSGVEDRVGNGGVAGAHTIVLSYPSSPLGATASVIAHNPSIASGVVSNVSYSGNDMIVNLTGVSDNQILTLTTSGGSVSPATVPVGLLLGDTNGDRFVNTGDTGQTRNRSGQAAAVGTFRSDVNADGTINNADVNIIRPRSGAPPL